MNSQKTPLAARRARLVAECARQRGEMADQLNVLKMPVERIGGAGRFLLGHRKSVLAGAGMVLGVLLARPKRVLGIAAAGASAWRIVQRVVPMVQRALPMMRSMRSRHLE